MLDSKNKIWDKLVSSYILFGESKSRETLWNIEKLQMYISLVGPKVTKMTKSANIILQSYYMTQRKSEHRDPSRTTVRMLDSLVRLSQAHCRLMYRTTILPMDAIIAVSLVDLSMQDCTLDDTVDALHSTFQKYPDYDYLCTAKKLLTRLNLYEIWHTELLYYAKLLHVDHKTLENNIESGNYNLFAKYDDVTDDNIALSATLVTSSYFNGKRDKRNELEIMNNDKEHIGENSGNKAVITEKLAATLKKHATLNKEDKNICNVVKKAGSNKRKRKQASVDISLIRNKIVKKIKKTKAQDSIDPSSSEGENDERSVLDAVPSVNDVFKDLELSFEVDSTNKKCKRRNKLVTISKVHQARFTATEDNVNHISTAENNDNVDRNLSLITADDDKNMKSVEIKSNQTKSGIFDKEIFNHDNKNDEMQILKQFNRKSLSEEANNDSSETVKKSDNYSEKPKVKTMDKLKQFQFVQKRDFSKYEEKVQTCIRDRDVVKIEKIKEEKSFTSQNRSSSSQISMFENEDYNIDLDI